MKRFLLFFIVFILHKTSGSAQVIIKANPGGLLFGIGSGSLEWFPTTHFSVQADFYLMPGTERDNVVFSGAGAGLSGRLYAGAADRPTGLFIAPFVAQHWITFEDLRSVEHRYSYTALGGQLGYQFTWKEKLTIEVGGGVWTGLDVPTLKQAFGVTDYFGEGTNVYLNFGLGLLIWKK